MLAYRLLRRLARTPSGATASPLGRRLGPLAATATVLALAAVVGGVAAGTPRPGLRGQGLGVTLATIAVVLCGLRLVARADRPHAATATMLVLGLASAALAGLDPNAPGYLGAFIAAGAFGLRTDRRTAAGATAAIVAAVTASFAVSPTGRQPSAIVSIDLGLLFAFTLARFAREQQRLVVELREAQEARAQAAALAERARLAREIHDVLAHSLTGLSVQLDGARLLLAGDGSDPAAIAAQVERAQVLARSGLDETRRAVGALRGDDMPGPELLPTLAADFERDTGIACRFDVDGEPARLSAETRLALYRTAQEALSNIRKHASAAQRVAIRLAWSNGTADLQVADDAPHSNGAVTGDLASTGGGYGLTGIRERAELLGGTLHAGPTETGFTVHLRLPA